jgi:hypothetical protein
MIHSTGQAQIIFGTGPAFGGTHGLHGPEGGADGGQADYTDKTFIREEREGHEEKTKLSQRPQSTQRR